MSLSIGLSIGIDRAFSGAAGGGLSAPSLGYPSPLAANPSSVVMHLGADWQVPDAAKIAYSASPSMSPSTVLSHAMADADLAAGTATFPLPTFSGITYLQGYGNHGGLDSANKSGIVTWGDTVAPTITTSGTQTNVENAALAVTLAATDTGGVPALVSNGTTPGWLISGGADRLQFQIAIVAGVPTLQWINNGTQAYNSPQNVPPNNAAPYNVQVTAIDYGGNVSTPLTISVTVQIGAPVLSNPLGSPGATSANLSVSTNQGTGTLYWVVSTNSTKPSAAQVQAGQDASGAAGAASGSQAVTASGGQSATATLPTDTTYYAYFVHINSGSTASAVAASPSFATNHTYSSLVVGAGKSTATFPGTPVTVTGVTLGAGYANLFFYQDYGRTISSVVASKTGQSNVTLTSPSAGLWVGAIPVAGSDWSITITDSADTPVLWAFIPVTVVNANTTPAQSENDSVANGTASPFAGSVNYSIAAGASAFRFISMIGTATVQAAMTATDGASTLATFNFVNFDGFKCAIVAQQMQANGTIGFSYVPTSASSLHIAGLNYNHA